MPDAANGRRRRADGAKSRSRILAFIRSYQTEHNRPPTYSEIGAEVGLRRQSVYEHLLRLQEDGYLTIAPRIARGITLTGKAWVGEP